MEREYVAKFEEFVDEKDLKEYRKEQREYNKVRKKKFHWKSIWYDYGESAETRFWCCMYCGYGIELSEGLKPADHSCLNHECKKYNP